MVNNDTLMGNLMLQREVAAIKAIQEHIGRSNLNGWEIKKDELSDEDDGEYSKEKQEDIFYAFGLAIKDIQDYKVGVVLDKSGRFVFARSGDENSVSFNEGELKDRVFIHNHPRGTSALTPDSDMYTLINCEAHGGFVVKVTLLVL
ncbi:MAG: hypothetical protein LBI42_00780 [Chitinispirillales bacterium]|nr:hypothetical protein [Chitinispirillales bacterium]